jgi:hypothetical protein
VHRASVEFSDKLHHARARFAVPRKNRTLNGRRATPARQQREVEVHHRHEVEDGRRNDLSIGNDHSQRIANSGGRICHVHKIVRHGDAERKGSLLHRTGRRRLASTTTSIGARDDQTDRKTGVDEGNQ